MIDSICIVRLSALGDVMMLLPLIRALQSKLPQAKLSWIISRPAYDLVEGMEGIDFIVIEKPRNIADYWQFKRQMRNRRFDILLALQTTLRANLLYPLIKAKRKIGYDMPYRSDGHNYFVKERINTKGLHTVDGYLAFARYLGINNALLRWDLSLTNDHHAWAQAQLPNSRPILVVNAAASKPERSWLPQRYIEVLKAAQKRWQVYVVLIGGPGESDSFFAEQISREIHVLNLVGKTKLKQLLAIIKQAKALLCPDTGPSHMAVAMNTPVIALHAVTNPLISGPYTCQHLVVNQYPKAILGQPCKQSRWGTQVHGFEAMKLIEVEHVMEKLERIFE